MSIVALKRVKILPSMQEMQVNPWFRKIPWRRAQQPTAVFLPGESHGQRSLMDDSPQGRKELTLTQVTVHTHWQQHGWAQRLSYRAEQVKHRRANISYHLYVESMKMVLKKLLMKQNRVTDVENKLIVTRGLSRQGVNWETEIENIHYYT